jgi:hypothetical protein
LIADTPAILQPLIGQPIWAVGRSYGSCFCADFGAVKEIRTFPARDFSNGRSTPERRVPKGEWSLLVEQCAWRIEAGGEATSHLDEDHPHMQGVMDRLENQIVTRVVLDEAALTLVFANGSVMRLGPADPVYPQEIGSQWMLTLPDGRYLTRTTKGAFELE